MGEDLDQFGEDEGGFGQDQYQQQVQLFAPCPPLQRQDIPGSLLPKPLQHPPQPLQVIDNRQNGIKQPRFTANPNSKMARPKKTKNQQAQQSAPGRPSRSTRRAVDVTPASENVAPNAQNNAPPTDDDVTVQGLFFNGVEVLVPTLRQELHDELIRVWTKAEALRLKYVKVTKEKADLQAKCDEMHETNVKLAKENAKFGKNDGQIAEVKKASEMNIFPFIKFITSKNQEMQVAVKVYRIVQQNKTGQMDPTIDEEHRNIWVNTYAETATSIVNSYRGYSQERMRVATLKFVKDNDIFPTVDELRLCALREIDMTNERLKLIFEWYITDLFGTSGIFVSCKLPILCSFRPFLTPFHHYFSSQGHWPEAVAETHVAQGHSTYGSQHQFQGPVQEACSPVFAKHGGLFDHRL